MEIRGEVVMRRSVFKRLNEALIAAGKKPMANPRNAAAGAMRVLDPKECAAKQLSFFPYDAFFCDSETVDQMEKLELMRLWGFYWNNEVFRMDGVTESMLLKHYSYFLEKRDSFDFDLDGIVVKYDRALCRKTLGNGTTAPKWAFAWKFPPMQAHAKTLGIRVQVGRTGVLTPVVDIEPTECGGVVVTKATLHNMSVINRLGGIKVGSSLIIQRGGDVIPDIVKVIPDTAPLDSTYWLMPNRCPSCGTSVELHGAKYYCPNGDCRDRIQRQFEYFGEVLKIDGLGPEKAMIFYGAGVRDLNTLAQVIDQSPNMILPKKVSLTKFIEALSIEDVGEVRANKLAQAAKEISGLEAMSFEGYAAPLGMVAGASAFHYIRQHWPVLAPLARLLEVQPYPVSAGTALAGKTVVVTGTLSAYTRDSIKAAILSAGGSISDSVSRKTSYLIVGADAGSKLVKAQALGVELLTEQQFSDMITS